MVLAGTIIGCAASVYDGINAVQTKEYGSELRGGDVSTGVIVSDERIVFPSVVAPDVLIVLAQQAFDAHAHFLSDGPKNSKKNMTLITDSEQVRVDASLLREGVVHYNAPFNQIADRDFGMNAVLNMVMLGFFAERTRIVSADALRKAVADLVPPKSRELNVRALECGIARGGDAPCP